MELKDNIELPDQGDNIIRTKDLDIGVNPGGLGNEIFIHLKQHSTESIAQIEAETGETDNYGNLLSRIIRVALHLKARGVQPGDVIAPCTSNHFDSIVVFIAPLLLGAKVACFDPNALHADMKALIQLVKPKVMFAEGCAAENLEKIKEELNLDMEIVIFGPTDKQTPFGEFLEPFPKDKEDGFEPYQVNDLFETAIIAFSSGSTGTSKGLCMHHFGILSQLGKMSKRKRAPIGIMYSPLAWVSGQVFPIVHILTGTARLICSKFTPEKTLRYLNKYPAVTLSLPPQDAMLMLKHGNPEKVDSPYLQVVMIAGGKMSVGNMAALGKIFSKHVLVVCPYGQSEIYGPAFSLEPQVFMANPSCVGKPIQGFTYKIVDPITDKICGPNEQGELCIKSRFCMSGYYNLDSSDRFDSDGFLKTGDMAYYDEDHRFYIVERLGERLKYKSQWIPPALLEGILYEHPAVKVASIIGVVSDDGDIATAVVVKNAEVSEEELVKLVNDRVDDIKKLRGGVIFVEDSFIPYTFSGKIRRFLLRKRILETYGELIKTKIPSYINVN